jgi:hypothetical protein
MKEMSSTELLKMSSVELTFNGNVLAVTHTFVILYHKHSCFSFQLSFLILFNVTLHYKD